jgi:tetratricopeptide (TPR) repeat protein
MGNRVLNLTEKNYICHAFKKQNQMSTQNNANTEDNFENVQSALSKTEQFLEKNQKQLSIVGIAIIAIVLGYWGLKEFYSGPREIKAQERVFAAQQYFEKDSFQLALNGDGNNDGFLYIIDNFGSTEAGNLANCYAGLSYLQLGKYNEAIQYLNDFSSNDQLLKYVALGAIGDAYLELGQKDKAVGYFKDAAKGDNELTAPSYLLKLGLLYEDMGKAKEAVDAYKIIKENYKNSAEARTIEKYIIRAELIGN